VKITVASVRKTGGRLTVTFDHDYHNTPEGRRALRILYTHIHHSHSSDRRSITMSFYRSDDVSAIDTQAKCQAEMDRLANVPITVEFSRPRVLAYGGGGILQGSSTSRSHCRPHDRGRHEVPPQSADGSVTTSIASSRS